ncbi:MAG TPA: vanadium-dependent haloperoxidase [Candidatus Solibacter sp.]|nr:vanadium-dependent haloperoxidase [Candidatus Solibacter sp.]
MINRDLNAGGLGGAPAVYIEPQEKAKMHVRTDAEESLKNLETKNQQPGRGLGRRKFLKGAATVGIAAAGVAFEPLLGPHTSVARADERRNGEDDDRGSNGVRRADRAFEIRVEAAMRERKLPIPEHPTNGDEQRFDNRIGNFSKGLPHNEFGEVDQRAYKSLLTAVDTERHADFERIILGGNTKLVNPQSGLAFDLEGADSHQLVIPPAPALAGVERAGEMVENYWMALARDIPFSHYGEEPITQAAIDDLNRLPHFTGVKDPRTGKVTARTLFRGLTAGETVGPYVSQFFVMPAALGALAVNDSNGNPAQQYNVYVPGKDYMTDKDSFLAVQDGRGPFGSNVILGPRFLHTARDINAFVHVDELYQAYFMATLNLLDRMQIPFNPGNPYVNSRTQVGFGTFGNPHAVTLLAEVTTRALKAVWYQKWFVHRALRPEAYAGLVHFKLAANRDYPLHSAVLNSKAVQAVLSRNGTAFLPMAFPEGSPTHPSYGAGHATVAGACATFVKAFFDENAVIPEPVVPSDDGISLLPYNGPDADKITVMTEANKIAGNVGLARNSAGVHWRSDQTQSILLGEAIAISILRDQRSCYNEDFSGFTFTKFDGTKITI